MLTALGGGGGGGVMGELIWFSDVSHIGVFLDYFFSLPARFQTEGKLNKGRCKGRVAILCGGKYN
jgi:hypothetical protein